MRPPETIIPLLLHMEGCATQAEMNANVQATIDRGYKSILPHLGTESGTVSLCGAAPSLGQHWQNLQGDVMAVNSAIGYLLGKGIVPKYAMLWDASALVENFAVPHPDITYLVASRCHPAVFERLRDCCVIVWHAAGDHNIMEFLKERDVDEPMINGGSAGVTRGMYLAVALGYTDLRLFGADSSYAGDATHIAGSLVPEKDMQIWVGKSERARAFRSTPEWAAQVEEYKAIYPYFTSMNIAVDVIGEGMLPYVAAMLKTEAQQAGGKNACN